MAVVRVLLPFASLLLGSRCCLYIPMHRGEFKHIEDLMTYTGLKTIRSLLSELNTKVFHHFATDDLLHQHQNTNEFTAH